MRPISVWITLLVGALLALAAGALPCDEQHQEERAQVGRAHADAAAQASQRLKRQATATNSTATRRKPTSKKNGKDKNRNKLDRAALDECLVAHNKWRRSHNVPELVWDDKLAAFAQKRSNHIAASDGKEFGHPPDLPFGENLFWHSSLETGCAYMVQGWYDEIKLYDFEAPSFDAATGHFTQLVWRGTERVGCAFATSSGPRGGLYLTCNYDPPGNWLGEFEANVPRPSLSGGPTTMAAPATTATGTSTARPAATATAATSATQAATTKPMGTRKSKNKSKNKNKNKKRGDKKADDKKNKAEEKQKKDKRRRKGKKKKTTTTTGSTTSAPLNATISAGSISS